MKKEEQTNISNCSFVGVSWDGKAIEAICSIAHALENLTNVFASQNIKIDSLISLNGKEEKW